MPGFVLSRGALKLGPEPVRKTLSDRDGAFFAVQAGDLEAVTSAPRSHGMGSVTIVTRSGYFFGYGDRKRPVSDQPTDVTPEGIFDWCERSFFRVCGAYSEPNRIILTTDALAGCPLFYAFRRDGSPVVSTEAKALLPYLSALNRLRRDRRLRAEDTIFDQIRRVPAGVALTLERHRDRWRETSTTAPTKPAPVRGVASLRGAAQIVWSKLATIVREMSVGHDEMAVSLSGGVDSSSVAALARPHVTRLMTFTVGTRFADEFQQAREVAAFLRTDHHELTFSRDDLENLLPDLIRCYETYDPLLLKIHAPLAFLCKTTAGYVATLLTGYGADLLFAGAMRALRSTTRMEKILTRRMFAATCFNELGPSFADRHGITVRHPFWSAEMLRVATEIPMRLKLSGGVNKLVLRAAAGGALPPCVAWRRKVGIHNGSGMDSLFAHLLGTWDEGQQKAILRQMAERVLLHQLGETARQRRSHASPAYLAA